MRDFVIGALVVCCCLLAYQTYDQRGRVRDLETVTADLVEVTTPLESLDVEMLSTYQPEVFDQNFRLLELLRLAVVESHPELAEEADGSDQPDP